MQRLLVMPAIMFWFSCSMPSTVADDQAQPKQAQEAISQYEEQLAEINKDYLAKWVATSQLYRESLMNAAQTELAAGNADSAQQLLQLVGALDKRISDGGTVPDVSSDVAAEKKSSRRRIPREAVRFNGHRYLVLPGSMPKRLAERACDSLGGKLVQIDSPEENEFIRKQLVRKNLPYAFIEGSDDASEGHWLSDNGKSLAFFNWRDGQPSNVGADLNSAENSIGISGKDGRWFDISSDARMGVIVEWSR